MPEVEIKQRYDPETGEDEEDHEKQIDFGFAKRPHRDALELVSKAVGQNLFELDRGMPFERDDLKELLNKMQEYLDMTQYLLHCIRYELNNWDVGDDASIHFTFQ